MKVMAQMAMVTAPHEVRPREAWDPRSSVAPILPTQSVGPGEDPADLHLPQQHRKNRS